MKITGWQLRNYEAAREQLLILDERIRQDSLFRLTQIASLDENILNMKRSLTLVRERLENLKVKAPIDGQVGNLEAQIGQSIAAGEHIGQIITADLKVQALIDEHYVERVVQELPADFTRDGENYKLEVTKVYPEVKVGTVSYRFSFYYGTSGEYPCRADLSCQSPVGRSGEGCSDSSRWRFFRQPEVDGCMLSMKVVNLLFVTPFASDGKIRSTMR